MLDKYESEHPDVVFLDIIMPVMNGIEALRALMEKHPDADVIMCSSLGEKPYINEALKYGARDFIIKPFGCDKILGAIKSHL
jgi:two-component system chemotaxis response regulator CheY